VVFVENGRKALIALRSNIESVALGGRVVDTTVRSFLTRCDDRFHLVFMDPPWDQDTGIMERDLTTLDRCLLPGAEVVVSRRHTDRIPDVPENWRVATDKRYGDTRILRYEKVESTE
jgi:16S rRNA G966 N2-methylase RsmD